MRGLKRVARRFDDWLSAIDPAAFERLLADHYRQAGWVVQECGTGGTGQRFDGGVDLRLLRGSEVVLVQCKRWNTAKVTHNAVHELLGIVVARNSTRGIVVNAGEFTEAAKQAAANSGGRIELVDGVALRAMLGDLAPAGGAAVANALAGNMAHFRRLHRAWWKAKLAGAVISLGLMLVAGAVAWSLFQHAIGNLQENLTQRAEARAQPSPPPRATRAAAARPARAPVLSPEERNMRRELVRTTARGLYGVTSAVWLNDRALFLGMGPSTPDMRSSSALEACALLARYPELPQAVEVQQTSGASTGDVARIACARGSEHAAVAPSLRQPKAPPPHPAIVMYGSPNCSYCRQAEAYFARCGLAFRNLDITASRQAHSEFLRLGGRGTPLILTNGEPIHGSSAKRLDAIDPAARG